MNTSSIARLKSGIILVIFMIISIGPIPITSTIGLFIVMFRPVWFKKLVDTIYTDKKD